jgi:cyclic pyranopterin phosphate synthase
MTTDPQDSARLTHVDETGQARMVDVSGKEVTPREAVATGRVLVGPEVVTLLRADGVPKGDALGVARVAGIMAAKRTPDLVPLCHPLAISGVVVDLRVDDDAVSIRAAVRTADRTGVEMEALTAVTVAALTVVDMVKAVDKAAVITDVRVESKSGGRSGDWSRPESRPSVPRRFTRRWSSRRTVLPPGSTRTPPGR